MERLHSIIPKDQLAQSITPDDVRGLSLEDVTENYKTHGLYVRLLDTLERANLNANNDIQFSLDLASVLHANDRRTNGLYIDHLMRVTIRMIEDYNITDPNLIAAGPIHDTLEDHPRNLVFELTGAKPDDPIEARAIGHSILGALTNPEIADIVQTVTNPIVGQGEDKLESYTRHTYDLVQNSPKGRVLKLSDFTDNAVNNHTTIGSLQAKLDHKYRMQYQIHANGLLLPDSLIVGAERDQALRALSEGYTRALGRLAVA